MLGQAAVIGFVPVRDLNAAEAFYAGVLGLKSKGSDGFALVLEAAGGIMIRCVSVPDAVPQPFTILGWEAPEIHAAARALKAAGVEPKIYSYFPQDEDGMWTAPNGDQVVWFEDPFGNVLSLSHHPSQSSQAAPGR